MIQVEVKTAKGINISVAEGKGITVPIVAKVLASMGGGGGTGIPSGGVTSDLIADGAVIKSKLGEDVVAELDIYKTQIAGILWSNATFGVTGGKTVYVGDNPSLTVTATFTSSELTPDRIDITLPDGTVNTTANAKKATYTDTVAKTSGNYTYKGKAVVGSLSKEASTTLYVRNKVYKGMGASYSAIMTDSYKHTATTSIADGSFAGTSPADGSKFFLIVPSDVTAPKESEFTMGGAPAAINKSTVTVNGITYNVFETKGSYNSGAELNLKW